MEGTPNKRSKNVTEKGETTVIQRTTSPSLSPMNTSAPRSSSDDDIKRKKAPQPPVKFSPRLQEKNQKEMQQLSSMVKGGKPSGQHSSKDVTPYFMKPLDPGNDNRGYVARDVRSQLESEILSTKRKVDTLDDKSLPTELSAMHSMLKKEDVGYKKISTRQATDGYKSGYDVSMTFNKGIEKDTKREPSDTPTPRSPNPYGTDEAVGDFRYEQAHQTPYQFTRQPGSTVFAPTQANQAVDTVHERFAAKKTNGFVFRLDTYDASTLVSARPSKKGGWKVIETSYKRRAVGESDETK